MYFGSVRFFKHLILATIVVTFAALLAWVLALSIENEGAAAELALLRADLEVASAAATLPPTEPPLSDGAEKAGSPQDASLYYQALYPNLYTSEPYGSFNSAASKTAYLSFDDGPGALTDDFLALLERENIKATFFIVGHAVEGNEDALRRIADAGHSIGLHSFSHEYEDIYLSVETFLDDFAKAYDALYTATGIEAEIFRFPGGSINGYNLGTYQPIIAEMARRGFVYYDWNISAEDAKGGASASSVLASVKRDYARFDRAFVLMHERSATLSALEDIIALFREAGYDFAPLNHSVKPVIFSYPA